MSHLGKTPAAAVSLADSCWSLSGALSGGFGSRRIASRATVADAFKYRNKIGLDVALEALREVWRDRRFTIDEIQLSARICRVERVMRPYLEALVA